MRSLVTAVFLFMTAISAAIAEAFVGKHIIFGFVIVAASYPLK